MFKPFSTSSYLNCRTGSFRASEKVIRRSWQRQRPHTPQRSCENLHTAQQRRNGASGVGAKQGSDCSKPPRQLLKPVAA